MTKTIIDIVREQVHQEPECVAAHCATHPDAPTRWQTASARDCMEEMQKYIAKHIVVTGQNPQAFEISSHLQKWLAQTEGTK